MAKAEMEAAEAARVAAEQVVMERAERERQEKFRLAAKKAAEDRVAAEKAAARRAVSAQKRPPMKTPRSLPRQSASLPRRVSSQSCQKMNQRCQSHCCYCWQAWAQKRRRRRTRHRHRTRHCRRTHRCRRTRRRHHQSLTTLAPVMTRSSSSPHWRLARERQDRADRRSSSEPPAHCAPWKCVAGRRRRQPVSARPRAPAPAPLTSRVARSDHGSGGRCRRP